MKLLENQTTDTDGSQPFDQSSGGVAIIQVAGTFDGASVTVQGDLGLGFVDLRDDFGSVVAVTESQIIIIPFYKIGLQLRLSVTGTGTATDISAILL